jgi:membrane protein
MPKDQSPSNVVLMLLMAFGAVTALLERNQIIQTGQQETGAGSKTGGTKARPQQAIKGGVTTTGAGSDAEHPGQIPAKGWWAVLKRTFAGFNEDRLMTEAAGVTFYTLLAIFPAIATLISLYGLVADPVSVNDQLNSLNGVIPGGGMDIIRDQVKSLTSNGATTLGFGVLLGLLTSLWSANQGIKALFDALNVVYHEKEKRGYIRFTLVCLMFTLGAILFIVVAMVCIAVVPIVLKFLGLENESAGLIAIARWPLLMVALAFLLATIYRYGPSRERARWQWVSWGSAFATVTWLVASVGFSYYVANFGSYNKTYGSLGAAIGFMTWIWISTIIVLLGAELNAELEQQTERDSTTGPELPTGQRGAFKADNKA